MSSEVLRELSQPRLGRWLVAVAFDWLVIAAAMTGARLALGWDHPLRWAVVFVAVVLIGARQHGLGIMGHDGAHRLACRNKWLNDAVTCLFCFWPLGFMLGGYRAFHFKHHQTVGTTEDPERIHTRHRWLGQWRTPLRPLRLLRQVALDFVGGSFPHLGMAAYLTRPISFKERAGPTLTLAFFLGACWWLDCLWIAALWFGAIVTSFWAVFRLRIWTEHTVEDENGDPTHRISATWWQRLLLQPHNTWCHWEHHIHPQVPAWNLPRIRELTLEMGPPIISLRTLVRQLRTAAPHEPSDTPLAKDGCYPVQWLAPAAERSKLLSTKTDGGPL